MNLQQFADRYGLKVQGFSIPGPHGDIYQGAKGWYYDTRYSGLHKFSPARQAKLAIEAIGLKYAEPVEPAKTAEPKPKKDRRAFLIEKKADGWYVADKTGPFKTRKEARLAKEKIRKGEALRC